MRSTFSDHVLDEGHEMRSVEETVKSLQFENGFKKIDALEEIEIIKATRWSTYRIKTPTL